MGFKPGGNSVFVFQISGSSQSFIFSYSVTPSVLVHAQFGEGARELYYFYEGKIEYSADFF
jgi:hypothetical protein